MDTGSPACSGGLRTCEVVVGWVMSGAERSPPVGWIRFFLQNHWVVLTPVLGTHLGYSKLAVCESSGGCECFGRNMSRCTSPDLLWDSVPFALLQGVRLEEQPNSCRQSLSMSWVAPRQLAPCFFPNPCVWGAAGDLWTPPPREAGRICPEG